MAVVLDDELLTHDLSKSYSYRPSGHLCPLPGDQVPTSRDSPPIAPRTPARWASAGAVSANRHPPSRQPYRSTRAARLQRGCGKHRWRCRVADFIGHRTRNPRMTRNPRTTTRNASLATIIGRRIVRPWCRPAGVFLFLTAGSVSGQQPGDSVRVSGEQVGVVVDADSAGLLLSSAYPPYAGMRTLEVPYAGMRSLEVWGGTRNHARRGFNVGFAAGTITTSAFGWSFCAAYDSCNRDAISIVVATGVVGMLTGMVGSLIGWAIETDIWNPVPVPGGVSLRLTLGGRTRPPP